MLIGYKFISQEIDKLEDFISAGDEIACLCEECQSLVEVHGT